jgi:hypothetical protein
MTDRDRHRWIAIVAVVSTAAVVALVAPPDALRSTGSGATRLFAALAGAAIVAVGALPALVTRSVGARRLWMVGAAVALGAGIGAYVYGSSAQRTCTARYDERAVLVGTEWTPLGETYAKENSGLSRDELLFDAADVADRLWTRASIDRCRTVLSASYFLWIPFLILALVACVHAVPTGLLPAAVGRPRATAPASPAAPLPLVYDVFISYRHGGHDTEVARDLLVALEQRGYRVAIDERDFPANASFLQEMERCIRQSRFTVAVVSSRYLGSGHCEEEAILCKVLDMGDRQRRLIPILIEPVVMPAWLFGIVGIDCTKPDPLVDPFEKLRATFEVPLSANLSRA